MANPTGRRGRPPHPDVLTPTEWRVLDLVRHGLSNRRIAALRGTSLDAVKYHVGNIAAKLDARDRTTLRHWQGRPRGSSTHTSRSHEMPEVTLGHIGQVSLTVRDVERAVAFYRDTLGLPHLGTFGTLALFDCDGTRLLLTQPEGGATSGSSVIYFTVADLDGAYRALQQQGVTFEGAPHLIHHHPSGLEEWMAFFRDPDANLLALMSQVQPT